MGDVLHISGEVTPDELEALAAGIREHAAGHGVELAPRELLATSRETSGRLLGGVSGNTLGRWLYVARLWVAEDRRGSGLGRRLMETAEVEAVRRGCREGFLNTFEFQARSFYEHLGYEVFATMTDPERPSLSRFWMRKPLAS